MFLYVRTYSQYTAIHVCHVELYGEFFLFQCSFSFLHGFVMRFSHSLQMNFFEFFFVGLHWWFNHHCVWDFFTIQKKAKSLMHAIRINRKTDINWSAKIWLFDAYRRRVWSLAAQWSEYPLRWLTAFTHKRTKWYAHTHSYSRAIVSHERGLGVVTW